MLVNCWSGTRAWRFGVQFWRVASWSLLWVNTSTTVFATTTGLEQWLPSEMLVAFAHLEQFCREAEISKSTSSGLWSSSGNGGLLMRRWWQNTWIGLRQMRSRSWQARTPSMDWSSSSMSWVATSTSRRSSPARISATRDSREQARPLTLEELTKLENLQVSCKDLIDKFMLGCILFAIFGRCRWSDLEPVASLEFDVVDTPDGGKFGFAEMRTRVHKTGGTEERKALFMPYVAPICGVCETPWALVWMDTMQKLEIDWTVKGLGTICRAPRSDGGFTKRPITTEEIAGMLNKFLGYGPKSPGRTNYFTYHEDDTSHVHMECTVWNWREKQNITWTS